MSSLLTPHFVASLSLILVACDVSADDESYDRGGLYAAPPPEYSADALGILRVVNEAGFEQLDDDVALDVRAARSIVEFRAGDDEVLDTPDDHYLPSMAELDQLYWVGPAAFSQLLNYAQLDGLIPAQVPPPSCEPALASTIAQCLAFVEQAIAPSGGSSDFGSFGLSPYKDEIVDRCLVTSEPESPSTDFFSSAGITGFEDPTLGYYDLLCELSSDPLCERGVAGLGTRSMPACEALFEGPATLTPLPADPADLAAWDATIATLNSTCGDTCDYSLRVFEYAPGAAPTLLGDVMSAVISTSPLGYVWPWLDRASDDTLPPISVGAQTLLGTVIDDLGLTGLPFEVAQAAEEVPCPNCHIFYDTYVLMFRSTRQIIVLDNNTFWDS